MKDRNLDIVQNILTVSFLLSAVQELLINRGQAYLKAYGSDAVLFKKQTTDLKLARRNIVAALCNLENISREFEKGTNGELLDEVLSLKNKYAQLVLLFWDRTATKNEEGTFDTRMDIEQSILNAIYKLPTSELFPDDLIKYFNPLRFEGVDILGEQ